MGKDKVKKVDKDKVEKLDKMDDVDKVKIHPKEGGHLIDATHAFVAIRQMSLCHCVHNVYAFKI